MCSTDISPSHPSCIHLGRTTLTLVILIDLCHSRHFDIVVVVAGKMHVYLMTLMMAAFHRGILVLPSSTQTDLIYSG